MIFRKFKINKDWNFFNEAENESYKATNNGNSIPKSLLEERKEHFKRFLSNNNFLINIMESDGITCGIFLAGVHENYGGNIGYIYNIYVKKECRCRGFGTLAMQKIVDFCQSKKCSYISLNVGADNTKAIKIYNKVGFKPKNLTMELAL